MGAQPALLGARGEAWRAAEVALMLQRALQLAWQPGQRVARGRERLTSGPAAKWRFLASASFWGSCQH